MGSAYMFYRMRNYIPNLRYSLFRHMSHKRCVPEIAYLEFTANLEPIWLNVLRQNTLCCQNSMKGAATAN